MFIDTIILAIRANKSSFDQYNNITKLINHDNIDKFPDIKKSIEELLIFDYIIEIMFLIVIFF